VFVLLWSGQEAGRIGLESLLQAKDRGACTRISVGTGDGDNRVEDDNGGTNGSGGETEWGKK